MKFTYALISLVMLALSQPPTTGGNELNVSIRLHPHKQNLLLGEPLLLRTTIHNVSTHTISILWRNFAPVYNNERNLVVLQLSESKRDFHLWKPHLSQKPYIRIAPYQLKRGQKWTANILILGDNKGTWAFPDPQSYYVKAEATAVNRAAKNYVNISSPVTSIKVVNPKNNEDRALYEILQQHTRDYAILVQRPTELNSGPRYSVTDKSGKLFRQLIYKYPKSTYTPYIALFLAKHNLAVLESHPNELNRLKSQISKELQIALQSTNNARLQKLIKNQKALYRRIVKKNLSSTTFSTHKSAPTPASAETTKQLEMFLKRFAAAFDNRDPKAIKQVFSEDKHGRIMAKNAVGDLKEMGRGTFTVKFSNVKAYKKSNSHYAVHVRLTAKSNGKKKQKDLILDIGKQGGRWRIFDREPAPAPPPTAQEKAKRMRRIQQTSEAWNVVKKLASAVESRDIKKVRQYYVEDEQGKMEAEYWRSLWNQPRLSTGKLQVQFLSGSVKDMGNGHYQVNADFRVKVDSKTIIKSQAVTLKLIRKDHHWLIAGTSGSE